MAGINEMFDACNEGWMKDDVIQYTGANAARYSQISDLTTFFEPLEICSGLPDTATHMTMRISPWDFCSFPAFPTHKVGTGATGYVVYNRTRNPDTAAALALFFLTEEGQTAYHSTSGGNVPLLKSLSEENFWRMPGTDWSDKNFDAFVSYPDASTPATVITRAPSEIAEILSDNNMINAFGRIINGTASVEDVFADLETRCNETWSKLNEY